MASKKSTSLSKFERWAVPLSIAFIVLACDVRFPDGILRCPVIHHPNRSIAVYASDVMVHVPAMTSHSYLSASSGFNRDAFHAGYSPPIRPVATPKPMPRTI